MTARLPWLQVGLLRRRLRLGSTVMENSLLYLKNLPQKVINCGENNEDDSLIR